MNIFLRLSNVAVVVILLAACAPTPPTLADQGAPAVESADEKSEAVVAPASLREDGLELFGSLVQIPFPYEKKYDRVKATAEGAEERQLALSVDGKDHKAYAAQLSGALKAAGFEAATKEHSSGWMWITVSDAEDNNIKVVVRPDANGESTLVVFKLPKA